MKNKELSEVYNALKTLEDVALPPRVAFAIRKNMNELLRLIQPFEEERIALVTRYGEKSENGELIVSEEGSVRLEDVVSYNTELAELEEMEQDFEMYTVSHDELERIQSALTSRQADALLKITK